MHFLRSPRLPYDPSYHLLYQPRRVRELARAFGANVLEAHSPYVAAASALHPLGSALRTTVWHSDFIDTYLRVLARGHAPSPTMETLARPLWAWVRRITRMTHATFCATRLQRDKLVAHGCENVHLLPFGVDKVTFAPERADPVVRAGLLAGQTGPLCVAIGRFAIEKRMDLVLEIFRRLKQHAPSARLVVYGDGPERATLEALAAQIGSVHFAGFTRSRGELASALASADLLLHACPYETFGLGVAEALATGLPAVLPDQGGAAELAAPEFAASYTSLDPEAGLVAALQMLARPRTARDLGTQIARARLRTEHEYVDAMLDHYLELRARLRLDA